MASDQITKRGDDFPQWYNDVVNAAKLAIHANVKGTINFLPHGWKIWTNITKIIDQMFKKLKVENVQLPLFIRYQDFMKEKKHVDGFAPELFLVNKKGEETLTDPLVVRPTSEVLFSQLFKQTIYSYHDLPIKYNQWCSVYRCEKNTKPFLRGSEFFWQELHAMFSSHQACMDFTLKIHQLYNRLCEKYLCLPILSGKKTEGEKFAGAEITYTREVWSQDHQCIQAGTSHYLGQNFSKMYDVKFQTASNQLDYCYYMSAGITTRLLGCLIVVHGDDQGLVLPFPIAPVQISIMTILANKDPQVLVYAKQIKKMFRSYAVEINDQDQSLGVKISKQTKMGTPILLLIGPNDVKSQTVTLMRRDLLVKQTVDFKQLKSTVSKTIKDYQKQLWAKANQDLQSSIVQVNNLGEFEQAINQQKIALCYWAGTIEDEEKIKKQYHVAPRCVLDQTPKQLINKKCFYTNHPAKQLVYFARAY